MFNDTRNRVTPHRVVCHLETNFRACSAGAVCTDQVLDRMLHISAAVVRTVYMDKRHYGVLCE